MKGVFEDVKDYFNNNNQCYIKVIKGNFKKEDLIEEFTCTLFKSIVNKNITLKVFEYFNVYCLVHNYQNNYRITDSASITILLNNISTSIYPLVNSEQVEYIRLTTQKLYTTIIIMHK